MDESFTMGALTSNHRKRGNDYLISLTSPPICTESYPHISKKCKLFYSPMSSSNRTTPSSYSRFAAARVALYPKRKQPVSRTPHAPVRDKKFGNFSFSITSERESSSSRMGNFLDRAYQLTKGRALESFRYVGKEKEVIQIDDDDDEEEDVLVDVSDDSSIEELDVFERKDRREKEFRSLDSSVVSDVSNVAEKMDVVLDGSNEELEWSYQKLFEESKKRDPKLKRVGKQIEFHEKRKQHLQSWAKVTKPKEVKKDRSEECFVALTDEEEKEVRNALRSANSNNILVSHQNSNIDISGVKLQCLKPGCWLNDEVINVYLELLKEREQREPQKFLKCHFFNTFFYKKLISTGGYNYEQVRRWTTKRRLGYSLSECDKIFVPIHQQIHWCLAVINKKEEKFQYLDSLMGVDHQVLDDLRKYFVDEVKDKNGESIDVSAWDVEYVNDLPEQENGYDCGMFMVKYADFYSRGLGLCFRQEHMPYFRRRTVKELLRLRAD